tara:strand:- start:49 stop:306 length:258 start_codon:yes stop_codon:yes gene_type:complete
MAASLPVPAGKGAGIAAIAAVFTPIAAVLAATAALLSVISEYRTTPPISVNVCESCPPSPAKAALCVCAVKAADPLDPPPKAIYT